MHSPWGPKRNSLKLPRRACAFASSSGVARFRASTRCSNGVPLQRSELRASSMLGTFGGCQSGQDAEAVSLTTTNPRRHAHPTRPRPRRTAHPPRTNDKLTINHRLSRLTHQSRPASSAAEAPAARRMQLDWSRLAKPAAIPRVLIVVHPRLGRLCAGRLTPTGGCSQDAPARATNACPGPRPLSGGPGVAKRRLGAVRAPRCLGGDFPAKGDSYRLAAAREAPCTTQDPIGPALHRDPRSRFRVRRG